MRSKIMDTYKDENGLKEKSIVTGDIFVWVPNECDESAKNLDGFKPI